MKKINGHSYSKESFDNYKLRAIVEFIDNDGDDYNIELYTTQSDVEQVSLDIFDMITEKVDTFRVRHTATKEQDDLTSQMIDEWLNDEM